ncbi:MAG: response regulator [Candidatus Omnitrophica bacterium]|nr:response regulator [Candidatus Omnitrophota bacterium]
MSRRVLIVDDEPELAKIVQVRLAADGYEVIRAENGQEALDKAESEKPELILLDVMMPKMHGLEALRRLKEKPETKDIPVVMLTAKDDKEAVSEASSLGAKDYITKPFNTEALLAAVKKYLP